MPQLRHPLTMLAVAFALGLCADLLFYGRTPGISAPLFVGLLLAALAGIARAEGRLPLTTPGAKRSVVTPGLLALLFAVLVAVRASPLLTVMNLLAALGLLLLHAGLYRATPLSRLAGWRVGLGTARAALVATLLPAPLALQQAGRLSNLRNRGQAFLVVGRGVALALPVLLIFTGLLTMADSIFASYVADVLTLRPPFDLGSAIGHIALIATVAWAVCGGLLVALDDHPVGSLLGPPVAELPAEGETQRLRPAVSLRVLGPGEGLTVLVLVDMLFAAFMLVQGTYLFGGHDTLERTGMTFATYARRGFFELVTVACLALALLWAADLITRRERPWQRRAFVAASAVMVVLVLGMLASAALRMWLYEQAYGFTLLRLLTHTWMIWLACVLLLFLVALVRERPRWFTMGVPAAAVAYLLALNLLNPDAMIVRENLARYQATGDLDGAYLTTLSADAVPALVAALPALGEHRTTAEAHLRARRTALETTAARDGLPGWNLGRARALGELQRL